MNGLSLDSINLGPFFRFFLLISHNPKDILDYNVFPFIFAILLRFACFFVAVTDDENGNIKVYILIFGGTHMNSAEQTGFKKRLLTSLEAAEYLGISHSYLRQLRSDGHIGRRVSPSPYPSGQDWVTVRHS